MPDLTTSVSHSPPIPSYIFRGHQAAIHALHFYHANHFLASGDSDGWIIIWRLTTRRPAAAWKAHDGNVMGIKDWGSTRLITHGRDHKLRVWQVRDEDLNQLSTKLPADGCLSAEAAQPWLVHSLEVNALNFCAFSICIDADTRTNDMDTSNEFQPLLLASPNGLDNGGMDVFQLPSEQRVSKLQSDKNSNAGMVMSTRIFYDSAINRLMLVMGYEDGQIAVYARKNQNVMPVWIWERLASSKPHTQPVLSLDVSPDHTFILTSSADATLAKFTMPDGVLGPIDPHKTNKTKHAGQQDLSIRSDGRVFATAGWDKNIRVFSAKTLKELAVLQWHQEGCYAIAFADVDPSTTNTETSQAVVSNAMEKFKRDRDEKIHNTHWLAAGSKDGKISLWDVY